MASLNQVLNSEIGQLTIYAALIYRAHGASQELAKAMATALPIGHVPDESYCERRVKADKPNDLFGLAYAFLLHDDARSLNDALDKMDLAVGIDDIAKDTSEEAIARKLVSGGLSKVSKVIKDSMTDIDALVSEYTIKIW